MSNGNVYLLHFDRPISDKHTCQHYLGFAKSDYHLRCSNHTGRLVQVARNRGISFTVVRVWAGDRSLERRLKRRKNSPKLCPLCSHGKEVTMTKVTEVFKIPYFSEGDP